MHPGYTTVLGIPFAGPLWLPVLPAPITLGQKVVFAYSLEKPFLAVTILYRNAQIDVPYNNSSYHHRNMLFFLRY